MNIPLQQCSLTRVKHHHPVLLHHGGAGQQVRIPPRQSFRAEPAAGTGGRRVGRSWPIVKMRRGLDTKEREFFEARGILILSSIVMRAALDKTPRQWHSRTHYHRTTQVTRFT